MIDGEVWLSGPGKSLFKIYHETFTPVTCFSYREALPRLDHFRVSKRAFKRPSLGELYGDAERKAVSNIIIYKCN